jgi:hypothetical protein
MVCSYYQNPDWVLRTPRVRTNRSEPLLDVYRIRNHDDSRCIQAVLFDQMRSHVFGHRGHRRCAPKWHSRNGAMYELVKAIYVGKRRFTSNRWNTEMRVHTHNLWQSAPQRSDVVR